MLQVAGGLFVVDQMIDGGVCAADGARVTMLHGNGAELHGLGIEGEQTVRQQFADACEILQGLCGLNGAQHTSDSPQYTSLRTSRYGSCGRWFLKHTTVTGRARQMGKRLTVEAQDTSVRERFTCHHTSIVDEELHGEVVRAVNDEVVLLNNIEGVRRELGLH